MILTLPLLDITPSEGESKLLNYKFTTYEKRLFEEIDSATSELPEDAGPAAYEKVAAEIGSKYGLTPTESRRFYIRSTFRIFE